MAFGNPQQLLNAHAFCFLLTADLAVWHGSVNKAENYYVGLSADVYPISGFEASFTNTCLISRSITPLYLSVVLTILIFLLNRNSQDYVELPSPWT